MSDFRIRSSGPSNHSHWSITALALIPRALLDTAKLFSILTVKAFVGRFSTRKATLLEAKAMHSEMKIAEVYNRVRFGNALVIPSRNIAQREIITNKKDIEATYSLLRSCQNKKHHNEGFYLAQVAVPENFDESCVTKTDGICSGAVLDFLIRLKTDDAATVASQFEKGGTVEAAANQALNSLLNPVLDKGALFAAIGDLAHVDQKSVEGIFKCRFDEVIHALIIADDQLREAERYETFQNAVPLAATDFSKAVSQMIRHELQAHTASTWLAVTQKSERVVIDPQEFKKRLTENLGPTYKNEIEWLTSLLELKNSLEGHVKSHKKATTFSHLDTEWHKLYAFAKRIFGVESENSALENWDKISNPQIRTFLKHHHAHLLRQQCVGAVCDARNASLSSVPTKFGVSGMMQNDASFLSGIENLPAGNYYIEISSGTGAHAIGYIKNSDSSGYIFDPNIGLIACRKGEHAKMLEKVFNQYADSPEAKKHLAKHGRHHMPRLTQVL